MKINDLVWSVQDGGHGEDEQLEDILDNDLTWELEIARK